MAKKITKNAKIEITNDKLVAFVIDEIANNIANNESAIADLLKKIPQKDLLSYLPKDFTDRIEVKQTMVRELQDLPCLQVTGCQVFHLKDTTGKTKALARVLLNEQIQLTGLRVVDGVNGLFVAYPNDPAYKGEDYRSLFYPVTKDVRDHIEETVLKMYHETNND